MPGASFHPRYVEARLGEVLGDTPVALLHGPRQSGKTTLARRLGEARDYAYFSFDDAETLWSDRDTLGQLRETFVYQELRRHASWDDADTRFFHFRDKDGTKVDFVLERGARELAGVEVEAAATVTPADFRGLRKLRRAAGKRFRSGVVLYDGETGVSFGDGQFTVPIGRLWEATGPVCAAALRRPLS